MFYFYSWFYFVIFETFTYKCRGRDKHEMLPKYSEILNKWNIDFAAVLCENVAYAAK